MVVAGVVGWLFVLFLTLPMAFNLLAIQNLYKLFVQMYESVRQVAR